MKRLFLSLSVMLLLCVYGFSAFAQNLEEFERERKAYKAKIASERGVSPLGVSPLGAASNLPVGRQMPATARALNMQTPEETRMQMQLDAENQKQKNEEMRFDAALKLLMPLTPEQIRELLDAFEVNRQSAETPNSMPIPRVMVETISLDPSHTPSVIKMSPGRVTTITILDQTGAPWAIQDIGWAGKFTITPPEEGGHVIRVVPMSAHGVGMFITIGVN